MDDTPVPTWTPRYFKSVGERRRGWRGLIRRGAALRFLVWQPDGPSQAATFSELFDYLGVSAESGARRDVYFCVDQARQIQEAGDGESWIEFPTGRAVQDPGFEAAP